MRRITQGVLLFIAAAALAAAPSEVFSATPKHPRAARQWVSGRSVGSPNEGHLVGGVQLQPTAYLKILPGHDSRWGLPDLVGLIDRGAKRVAAKFAGSVLSVGDLSRRGGGDVSGHHSHESGRDADVGFYVVGADGKPLENAHFITFDERGRGVGAPNVRFDDARNWALVESWLTDPVARVNRIFIAEHLRSRLLAAAKRAHVSEALRHRAASVLFQPKGATHDDHFHVRIGCPRSQKGSCLEYVTRETRPTKTAAVAKRKPVLAKARKRNGTVGQKAPTLAGVVPAPDDFNDARADRDEVVATEDEGGEPRVH